MRKPTTNQLSTRLDTLVQTICRCKGAVKKEGVWQSQCVTCGKWCPCFGPKSIQGGHYIPRGCRITRWLEQNVYPQCNRCNGFLNGNYLMYSYWMNNNHKEDAERLMNLFKKHKQGNAPTISVVEKQALYNKWLKKGRELEGKTGENLFPKTWDYVE